MNRTSCLFIYLPINALKLLNINETKLIVYSWWALTVVLGADVAAICDGDLAE